MTLTVRDILAQPQLQLSLLAGRGGLGRDVEWAHTCDLPDPWKWVGARQILLTNGNTMPKSATGQCEWAALLAKVGVAAIGIGDSMGAPPLTAEFLAFCNQKKMPVFTIPYPLPFTAVAQAVAESTNLIQAQRLRLVARLYEFSGHDLLNGYSGSELITTVGDVVMHDIALVDARCFHSWFTETALPSWLSGATARRASTRQDVAQVWSSPDEGLIHAVPLPAMPEALAFFRPREGTIADPSLLLHAASVLRTSLSRRALEELQENRRHVDVINRILADQNRFNFESEGWMRQMGYVGMAQAIALMGGSEADREAVNRRLQRHGVKLSSTLQGDRHLVIAQHEDLASMVEHCLDGQVTAGLGLLVPIGAIHDSLQESLWALLTAQENPQGAVAQFNPERSWMGFHGPHDGEHFVRKTLAGLLEESPTRRELLNTLRTYLSEDRSPQRTAQTLMMHRQTVIQRLHKIEDLLGVKLSHTSVVAKLWMALTIHGALEAGNDGSTQQDPATYETGQP
ncbi:PucR family transcriptional regulator [Micrococcus sp. TA1]|uniref:PucR family transcriptional regulator n=1 Tax=Micrococcus sp. TA1 TaxID=681627 RepID=UPI0016184B92|nr:PucR family transcriptional regulator [Micrococcus sp. TA1]MBB5747959.1 purine catabolism regulator [Micrococcus sp. TA1]